MFSFAAVAPPRDGTHGFVPTYWYRWLMPSDAGDDIAFVIGRLFVVAHDAGATRTAQLREPWPELVRVARDTPALRFRAWLRSESDAPLQSPTSHDVCRRRCWHSCHTDRRWFDEVPFATRHVAGQLAEATCTVLATRFQRRPS